MPKAIDLTGRRFGRLLVTACPPGKNCDCRCDCGSQVSVRRSHIKDGRTKSCGCLRAEVAAAKARSHGMTGSAEHQAYWNAKNRCERPADVRYPAYGGRGIEMRFKSFDAFFAEVGPRPTAGHSLDRIDANGHYEPGNIRWSTRKQQAVNKRGTLIVTIGVVTKSLKEWCEDFGQPYKRVWERIRDGAEPEDALRKQVGPTARRSSGERAETIVVVSPAAGAFPGLAGAGGGDLP